VHPKIIKFPHPKMSLKEYVREGLKESFKESFKKRRSKLEIIADVLSAARGGANKTAIAHNANLNFNRVENYLSYLVEKGLMEHTDGEYKTTEKGREFLRDYQKMKELLKR